MKQNLFFCIIILVLVQQSLQDPPTYVTSLFYYGEHLRHGHNEPIFSDFTNTSTFDSCSAKLSELGGALMQFCDAKEYKQAGQPIFGCNVFSVTWEQMLASNDIIYETLDTGCYWYGPGANPNICQSNNQAVPDSWCQTYCFFDNQNHCTGVQDHMTAICVCSPKDLKDVDIYCKSISSSATNQWCKSYCHIVSVPLNGAGSCWVDQHMSSICACI